MGKPRGQVMGVVMGGLAGKIRGRRIRMGESREVQREIWRKQGRLLNQQLIGLRNRIRPE